MIKLIIAIGPNNLIGNGTNMAWNIKEEFNHFRETTIGHSLLFGQNTFVHLPRKLIDRTTYVFGFTTTPDANYSITSIEEIHNLFKKFESSQDILFIAGGKYLYENFYQFADELIISEIKTPQEGDVYINWNLNKYTKTIIKDYDDFSVFSYIKNNISK